MNPKEYRYTQEHEWICPEPGGKGRVGITDYAQSQLGDIVFLDLPAPGTKVTQFEKMGEIETVKAVSDLFSPVSGEILEINQAVIDDPRLVNEDPYGAGWLVRLALSQPTELEALMSSDEYAEFVAGLSEES
ncbi:MAG TPA: glycine cleavage system protein GcvH [Dehalococcoidia bacterium]|jgi:glycine cleavage system H protein|nr:glycine cleavage system protein GcvH [Dehalococcoidia bacterium]